MSRLIAILYRACLLAVALAAPGWTTNVAAQAPGGRNHIAVEFVPEALAPAPGSVTTVAIAMTPEPGWHGYWRTPGDAGLPAKFNWTLPADTRAGEVRYPVPGRLLVSGLMNYVYDRPYALLVPVTIARNVAAGTKLLLTLEMSYLACTREVCLPEKAQVAVTLTVGNGTADPATAVRFATWRAALPAVASAGATHSIENGSLRLAMPLGGRTAANPYLFVDGNDLVNFSAPQSFSRSGDTLIVETAAVATAAPDRMKTLLDLGNGHGIEVASTPGIVPPAGEPLGAPSSAPAGSGWLMLTLTAFVGAVLGGLILNIMPCVFPILSLKALSLARSGEDDRSARIEAIAYSAGVIVVCVVLGTLILALRAAGTQIGWAFQLQSPIVVFGLILLVGAIAFNLAGLFEFSNISVGSGLAAQSGASGAFWTGALAAFVATPCTGPFMAAALGAALVLPVAAAMLIFVGLGLGLAIPFLAIGFIPRLRKALPRPGPWMNTLRHILAIPMFVTALGLAWVIGHQTGTAGIIVSLAALLILAMGLWAMGLRQRGLKAWAWAPAVIAMVLALALAPLLPTQSDASARTEAVGRQPFDGPKLAALRAEGKPVFLYLTADWCLSCKVNEKVAIERSETQAAFAKAGVVTMVGDWTNGNPAITEFLEKNGRSGVPLYLWYAPGKEARSLPQILTTTMLAGLARQATNR